MKRFVEGADREQLLLFPECLDDWVDENNLVRVIDAFVDALDLCRSKGAGKIEKGNEMDPMITIAKAVMAGRPSAFTKEPLQKALVNDRGMMCIGDGSVRRGWGNEAADTGDGGV
jgi:transposase